MLLILALVLNLLGSAAPGTQVFYPLNSVVKGSCAPRLNEEEKVTMKCSSRLNSCQHNTFVPNTCFNDSGIASRPMIHSWTSGRKRVEYFVSGIMKPTALNIRCMSDIRNECSPIVFYELNVHQSTSRAVCHFIFGNDGSTSPVLPNRIEWLVDGKPLQPPVFKVFDDISAFYREIETEANVESFTISLRVRRKRLITEAQRKCV